MVGLIYPAQERNKWLVVSNAVMSILRSTEWREVLD
jgi:hypothetical protein